MSILALDLGTKTGWAIWFSDGSSGIVSGEKDFKNVRFEGGGMRYLKFRHWLDECNSLVPGGIKIVAFEEVRQHGIKGRTNIDAAHAYGGFMATLTTWCEGKGIAYYAEPVGTIKKHATGKGNSGKPEMITAMIRKGHTHLNADADNEADALALIYLAKEKYHAVAGDLGERPAHHSKPRRRVSVGDLPVARKRVGG